MKTAEEYLPHQGALFTEDAIELIRQVQQDSKEYWIDRCAGLLAALQLKIKEKFNSANKELSPEIEEDLMVIQQCTEAILDMKTEKG